MPDRWAPDTYTVDEVAEIRAGADADRRFRREFQGERLNMADRCEVTAGGMRCPGIAEFEVVKDEGVPGAHVCGRCLPVAIPTKRTVMVRMLPPRNLTTGRDPECPFTHAHTRHWCGYQGCRDS